MLRIGHIISETRIMSFGYKYAVSNDEEAPWIGVSFWCYGKLCINGVFTGTGRR